MSGQEMVSHCCGAEIHHGHCTKCEKPCREEQRRHNAITGISPAILRAQARASSTDFSTMDRMPGPHALRAAALYVEEKLDFTTTWPHSFALAGYQWRADIDRIEPARSPDECMVAHIGVQCIASDTVFNRFKRIHHVENPDLPMDKDLKPDIAFTIKPTEHNPLLSEEEFANCGLDCSDPLLFESGARWADEQIRAKLTSGELRVVKPVVRILEHMEADEMGAEWPIYTHEGGCFPYFDEDAKFCPGCGSSILPAN